MKLRRASRKREACVFRSDSTLGVIWNVVRNTERNPGRNLVGYASRNNRSVKDLRTYVDEFEAPEGIAEAMASKISFKVLEIEESEDRASANVEITMPDPGSLVADLLGLAMKSAFGDSDEQKMEEALAEKLEDPDLPLTTKTESFHLIREEAGWKVFLDWKAEIAAKRRKAEVEALLAEARQLREGKRLEGAVEKYAEALELDSEMVEAKEGLAEAQGELEVFQEKQAYVSNVVLYDFEARYYESYSDKDVPGVTFKLKNTGDRTLSKVAVIVYFRDASDVTIAEENLHPVWITEYSSSDEKPLKPNYIWQLERGRFYEASSVPSEWKEGAASAKIVDIEFAQ